MRTVSAAVPLCETDPLFLRSTPTILKEAWPTQILKEGPANPGPQGSAAKLNPHGIPG